MISLIVQEVPESLKHKRVTPKEDRELKFALYPSVDQPDYDVQQAMQYQIRPPDGRRAPQKEHQRL